MPYTICIVLIPAYQPQAELTDLLAALKQRGFSLVAVDDGSAAALLVLRGMRRLEPKLGT